MGAAAARAERVVDARFRGARCQYAAEDVDPCAVQRSDREAMRIAGTQRSAPATPLGLRLYFILVLLILAAVALAARAVDLQLMDHGFLTGQGDARYSLSLIHISEPTRLLSI